MRVLLILFITFSFSVCQAQQLRTLSSSFEHRIDQLLSETIPQTYVAELSEENMNEYVLLDAREWEEYETSHIQGARYIGYDKPAYSVLSDIEKDKKILLYCSIGYRSEKIGEELQKRGFQQVFNLYGSIFEWVNQGRPVYTIEGKETKNIHTYNKRWSKWMSNVDYVKVW